VPFIAASAGEKGGKRLDFNLRGGGPSRKRILTETCAGLRLKLGVQALQRPLHRDGGAFAGRAVDRKGAAQQLHQLGADVETEPGSPFAAQRRGAAVGNQENRTSIGLKPSSRVDNTTPTDDRR